MHPRNWTQKPSSSVWRLASAVQKHQRGAAKGAILSASQNQTAIKPAKSALALPNVLFATDFSAACNNAWWHALAVAKHYQSKLFIVHVISPLVYRSVPPELLAEAQKRTRLE